MTVLSFAKLGDEKVLGTSSRRPAKFPQFEGPTCTSGTRFNRLGRPETVLSRTKHSPLKMKMFVNRNDDIFTFSFSLSKKFEGKKLNLNS